MCSCVALCDRETKSDFFNIWRVVLGFLSTSGSIQIIQAPECVPMLRCNLKDYHSELFTSGLRKACGALSGAGLRSEQVEILSSGPFQLSWAWPASLGSEHWS